MKSSCYTNTAFVTFHCQNGAAINCGKASAKWNLFGCISTEAVLNKCGLNEVVKKYSVDCGFLKTWLKAVLSENLESTKLTPNRGDKASIIRIRVILGE